MAVHLDDRGATERMHSPEFRRRAEVGVSRVALNVVRQPKLLEQPQRAQGTRMLQVVDDQA